MNYSLLFGFIFLNMVVCAHAMQDTRGKNPSKEFIKVLTKGGSREKISLERAPKNSVPSDLSASERKLLFPERLQVK